MVYGGKVSKKNEKNGASSKQGWILAGGECIRYG